MGFRDELRELWDRSRRTSFRDEMAEARQDPEWREGVKLLAGIALVGAVVLVIAYCTPAEAWLERLQVGDLWHWLVPLPATE